jgi:hypothetical protein
MAFEWVDLQPYGRGDACEAMALLYENERGLESNDLCLPLVLLGAFVREFCSGADATAPPYELMCHIALEMGTKKRRCVPIRVTPFEASKLTEKLLPIAAICVNGFWNHFRAC